MTPAFCRTFVLALDIIEHRFPKGVVVTTSAITKFFSNGLDYESAIKTKGFFEESLYPLWRRLITSVQANSLLSVTHLSRRPSNTDRYVHSYSMPTVALINGHAFAAGFMTAMYHDYRFMNPHRGFLCLNELDFGAPLMPPMASVFRQKLPRPDTYRTMVLESKRFNALESLKEGIVDGLGGWEETIEFIKEMKLVGRADSGVYGRLKEEMWRDSVALLEGGGKAEEDTARVRAAAQKQRDEDSKRRVDEWEKEKMSNGRSNKL